MTSSLRLASAQNHLETFATNLCSRGLAIPSDVTRPVRLGARLRAEGARWGGLVLWFDRVSSTNEVAARYAKLGVPHGTVILAREQTAGRGRYARRWESHPGGLYMSIVLRPEADHPVSLLPHLVAVATADAIASLTSSDQVHVRWPNDLYVSGAKLAGILCEGSFRGSSPDVFVAGIGVNVNPDVSAFQPEVRERVATLAARRYHEHAVAARVVSRLESWWREREPEKILSRFREWSRHDVGHAIEVQPREGAPFRATIRGVADDGGLIVSVDGDGERILYSEDVFRLRETDAST